MADPITSTRDINRAIRDQITKSTRIKVGGLSGQNSVAVGIKEDVEITIEGNAGDFFAALNSGPVISLNGSAGRFLGDTLTGGGVIVSQSAQSGVGHAMSGGIIIVRGSIGDMGGVLKSGGSILVDGDVGNRLGMYMTGGDIIVTGVAGEDTGQLMLGGAIYVRGGAKNLGDNAKVVETTQDDATRLDTYFKHYNISAKGMEFKKIVASNPRTVSQDILGVVD